jgi:tRNA pseudouridine38-40 synthase
MPIWKFTIAYDGANFAGWQEQPESRSVQLVMETAWRQITGESVRLVASGRTDAGVHAIGQVVGVETNSPLSGTQLMAGLNSQLPEDVAVLKVEAGPIGFHAVVDAVSKQYRYTIHNSRVAPVLDRLQVWHVRKPLKVEVMQQAAKTLVGTHDFSSFSVAKSQRESMIRTVASLDVRWVPVDGYGPGSHQILFDVVGQGFLHHMVRIFVGSLVWVGQGSRPASWMAEVLAARDRRSAGQTAPPQGLKLIRVEYES